MSEQIKKPIYVHSFDSIEDFLPFIKYFSFNTWIFRGHADSTWKLQTSYERAEREDKYIEYKELDAIKLFQSYSQKTSLSPIETLAIMQHYGTKTRLLDFSFSITIALWFAYENFTECASPCIWCINYDILLKSVCDFMSACKYIQNTKKGMPFSQCWEQIKEIDSMVKKNYFVREFCISLANKILEGKSKYHQILPIILPANNDRLNAQSGLFLFQGSDQPMEIIISNTLDVDFSSKDDQKLSEFTSDRFWREIQQIPIIKLEFTKNAKLNESIFRLLNISARQLYPDLEGLAKSFN